MFVRTRYYDKISSICHSKQPFSLYKIRRILIPVTKGKRADVWACRIEWKNMCECVRRHLLIGCVRVMKYARTLLKNSQIRPCVFVRINSIEHFKTSASKTHSSHFTVKQLLPLSFQTCVSTLQRQLFFIEAGFILHCNSFVILTFNLICIPLHFSTSYP